MNLPSLELSVLSRPCKKKKNKLGASSSFFSSLLFTVSWNLEKEEEDQEFSSIAQVVRCSVSTFFPTLLLTYLPACLPHTRWKYQPTNIFPNIDNCHLVARSLKLRRKTNGGQPKTIQTESACRAGHRDPTDPPVSIGTDRRPFFFAPRLTLFNASSLGEYMQC